MLGFPALEEAVRIIIGLRSVRSLNLAVLAPIKGGQDQAWQNAHCVQFMQCRINTGDSVSY